MWTDIIFLLMTNVWTQIIRDPKVKQVIYEFYKQHHPEYLKENLPDDMTDVDILDCLKYLRCQITDQNMHFQVW